MTPAATSNSGAISSFAEISIDPALLSLSGEGAGLFEAVTLSLFCMLSLAIIVMTRAGGERSKLRSAPVPASVIIALTCAGLCFAPLTAPRRSEADATFAALAPERSFAVSLAKDWTPDERLLTSPAVPAGPHGEFVIKPETTEDYLRTLTLYRRLEEAMRGPVGPEARAGLGPLAWMTEGGSSELSYVIPELNGRTVLQTVPEDGAVIRADLRTGDSAPVEAGEGVYYEEPVPADAAGGRPAGMIVMTPGAKTPGGRGEMRRFYPVRVQPKRFSLPKADAGPGMFAASAFADELTYNAADLKALKMQEERRRAEAAKHPQKQPSPQRQSAQQEQQKDPYPQQQQQQQSTSSAPESLLVSGELFRLTLPMEEGKTRVISGSVDGKVTVRFEDGSQATDLLPEGYMALSAVNDPEGKRIWLSVKPLPGKQPSFLAALFGAKAHEGEGASRLAYSDDGGKRFILLTPWRLPPPLPSFALLLGLILIVVILRNGRAPAAPAPGMGALYAGMSDRALTEGDHDVTGVGALARALSRFIRNTDTAPPITFGVIGPWGSGKSSVMQMAEADLRRHGMRVVRFNVWHHRTEENLLDALLANIREQATPPPVSATGLLFRGRLLWERKALLAPLAAGTFGLWLVMRFVLPWLGVNPAEAADLLEPWVRKIAEWLGGDNAEKAGSASSVWQKGLTAAPFTAALLPVLKTLRPLAPALVSKLKESDQRLSFRYRFAREFNQICRVMRKQYGGGLAVIVDDLDRCPPDVTALMTEAVNFLAESGECFVILGYDERRVTEAVNRSRELPEDHTYGAEYLRKIVNIPLRIPEFDHRKAAELVRGPLPPSGEALTLRGRMKAGLPESLRRRLITAADGLVGAFALLATAAAVLFMIWHLPPTVREWMNPEGAPVALEAESTDSALSAPAASSAVSAVPTPRAVTGAPSGEEAPEILPKENMPLPFYFRYAPAFLTLMAVGVVLAGFSLVRKSVLRTEEKDEKPFCDMLAAWAPAAFEHDPTPRGLKRFNNYARFCYAQYKSRSSVLSEPQTGGLSPERCAACAGLAYCVPSGFWPRSGETAEAYVRRFRAEGPSGQADALAALPPQLIPSSDEMKQFLTG